jgi:hypothetical protein
MELKLFVEDENKFHQLLDKEFKNSLDEISNESKKEISKEEEEEIKNTNLLRKLGIPGFEENYERPNFTTKSIDSVLLSKESCYLVDFNVKRSEIKSIYKDSINKIHDQEVMIISLGNNETYTCLYEEEKFNEIKELLF